MFKKLKNLFNSKPNKKAKKDDKKFPWLMENKGDLTLEETTDIEELLEDDD